MCVEGRLKQEKIQGCWFVGVLFIVVIIIIFMVVEVDNPIKANEQYYFCTREPISKRDKQNEKLGNKRKLEKVRNKELRDQEIRDEGVWSISVLS